MSATGAIPKASAGLVRDAEGEGVRYTLTLGGETITLEPGRAWIQADAFKWVTRGLLEEPQSYHVTPDGTVEINGEKIALTDLNGVARLEHEVNKRHAGSMLGSSPAKGPSRKGGGPPRDPTQVTFRVRVDRLGHLVVTCFHGDDHLETGLRGLTTLVTNGLMRKPGTWHVDPLQRWIEIDGHRFGCNEEDARRFEALLNAEYKLKLKAPGEGVIEIKDNPASATGFDIHFTSFHGGLRTEVKGHLTQKNLDLLQNDQKCDLLQHGVVLRLSPPNLLIRRRRPDGGEERIADIPDVAYRRVKAAELQRIFNDPRLRRTGRRVEGGGAGQPLRLTELREIRVVRHPENRFALWVECVAAHTPQVEGMALTHHNIAELQQRGVFREGVDVAMSVDARELSVLDSASRREDKVLLQPDSPGDELAAVGRLLSGLLKEPSSPPANPPVGETLPPENPPDDEEAGPAQVQPGSVVTRPEILPPPVVSEAARVPEPPRGPADVLPGKAPERTPAASAEAVSAVLSPESPPGTERFPEQEPRHVIEGVFSALTRHVEAPLQEVRLSLPRVFVNRRFVVLNFSGPEIGGLNELRSDAFYGFYLSFVDPQTVILVYACQGRHIEWGIGKCVVQPSLSAEAEEFDEPGLLGLAQDSDANFLFVVTPGYRRWISTREREYRSVYARFLTAQQFESEVPRPTVIWPE